MAAAERPPVLVLGDSISAGYGIPVGSGWVALLEQRLAREGIARQVVNAAISGDTSAGALERLPPLLERWRPAVVIVEIGGNDGLRGLPLAELRANLAAIVAKSRAAGAAVVMAGMRLPPNYGPAYEEGFAAGYRRFEGQEGVTLLPFLLEGVAERPELMQEDGIHPTAAAQPRLLENLWPLLRPLLQ